MSLRHPYRLVAVLAACLLLTACNSDTPDTTADTDEGARVDGSTTQLTDETEGGPTEGAATEGAATEGAATEGASTEAAATEATETEGSTMMVDAGCQLDLPAEGAGSAEAMAQETVGTAASNNPELSTLVEAATEAGLFDTLNDPEGVYTILAPTNDAFDALDEGELDALLADQQALTEVLTYHVIGDVQLSLQELVDEGSVATLQANEVTFEAEDEQTVTVNGEAEVVCADVQTANAIVHIVDAVLMPDQSAADAVDDGAGGDEGDPTDDGPTEDEAGDDGTEGDAAGDDTDS